MKTLLYFLLKIQYQQRRSPFPKSTCGFTMLELLVATVIVFLITVPLLTLAVDLIDRDVKEQAKAKSEQELQVAIDYITQDLSQAFYIYAQDKDEDENQVLCIQDKNKCKLASTVSGTAAIPTDLDSTAKLIFWKRKHQKDAVPLGNDNSIDCSLISNKNQCNDTFVFSLVVYYQEQNSVGSVWCKKDSCLSRISRVEIEDNPKYINSDYVYGQEPKNGFSASNLANVENPENLIKGDGDFPPRTVLINDVESFDIESPTNSTARNKLAKVTILGNALHGREKDFSCIEDNSTTPPTYKKSPYCPKATAQVGGISTLGFGDE